MLGLLFLFLFLVPRLEVSCWHQQMEGDRGPELGRWPLRVQPLHSNIPSHITRSQIIICKSLIHVIVTDVSRDAGPVILCPRVTGSFKLRWDLRQVWVIPLTPALISWPGQSSLRAQHKVDLSSIRGYLSRPQWIRYKLTRTEFRSELWQYSIHFHVQRKTPTNSFFWF